MTLGAGVVTRFPAGPVAGLVGQFALLAALASTVGLGPAGWSTGTAYALVTCAALGAGLVRSGGTVLGPANRVTLARAILAGGVAALVADAVLAGPAALASLAPPAGLVPAGFPPVGPAVWGQLPPGPVPPSGVVGQSVLVTVLAVLTAVALSLDAVDGKVARRTGSASALGARFDMETDAFLILVLSVFAARWLGGWVLLIGALRYAFAAAAWMAPWLRAPLPPKTSRKTVAALQGIALLIAVTGLPPAGPSAVLVALALALLCWSFGRDIGWLWRTAGPAGVWRVTEPGRVWRTAGLVWRGSWSPAGRKRPAGDQDRQWVVVRQPRVCWPATTVDTLLPERVPPVYMPPVLVPETLPPV